MSKATPTRRRRSTPVEWLLWSAAAACVIYLVSGPLLVLLLTAFRQTDDALPFEPQATWTIANFVRVFSDPALYASVVPQTIVYTAAAVVITMVLGSLFAWLIERSDIPFSNMLFVVLVSPLVIPTVVKAIAWVYLLGPRAGYLNLALRDWLHLAAPGPFNIFSLYGVTLVQGLELVPLGVVFMAAAFRRIDPALEEASAACGATPITTLARITLPVLLPTTLALAIITTTLTLEMVEIPLAIGTPGGVHVFSTWMFFAMNPAGMLPNYGLVAAAVAPVFLLGVGLLLMYNRATRVAERYVTVTGKGYRPRRVALGKWKGPALAACGAYLLLTLVLPALVMLMMSLFPEAGRSEVTRLGPLSYRPYVDVLTSAVTIAAFRNTVMAGGLGATVAVSVATIVSWLVVRTKVPGRHALDFMCFAPITIPAVIMGFAIGLLYLVLPIPIYGTVWILAVAYATRMSVASRIVRASLTQIHRELEEASFVSGGDWVTTLRRVILPLLAPAVLVSWLLVFVVSIREFTVGMILSRPANVVVGVHLWRLYERGNAPEASALGLTMIVVVFILAFFGRRFFMPELGRSG